MGIPVNFDISWTTSGDRLTITMYAAAQIANLAGLNQVSEAHVFFYDVSGSMLMLHDPADSRNDAVLHRID